MANRRMLPNYSQGARCMIACITTLTQIGFNISFTELASAVDTGCHSGRALVNQPGSKTGAATRC